MNMRTIYLAGGCYWGVEKYCANIAGVVETEVGFANGHVDAPAYVQVKKGDTGHAETVRVAYDADVLPLEKLLRLFFRIIDPTSFEQQGEDVGNQYRTGVYWTDPADEAVVLTELAVLQSAWAEPLVVAVDQSSESSPSSSRSAPNHADCHFFARFIRSS